MVLTNDCAGVFSCDALLLRFSWLPPGDDNICKPRYEHSMACGPNFSGISQTCRICSHHTCALTYHKLFPVGCRRVRASTSPLLSPGMHSLNASNCLLAFCDMNARGPVGAYQQATGACSQRFNPGRLCRRFLRQRASLHTHLQLKRALQSKGDNATMRFQTEFIPIVSCSRGGVRSFLGASSLPLSLRCFD